MPARTADTRIPVPVAESQLSVKMASSGFVGLSGVGSMTTGEVRTTMLCKAATWNFGAETSLSRFFICGTPQRKTNRLNMTHGIQARKSSLRETETVGARPAVPANPSLPSCADKAVCAPFSKASPILPGFQLSFGLQNFNRAETAAMDAIAATMSTSHGP